MSRGFRWQRGVLAMALLLAAGCTATAVPDPTSASVASSLPASTTTPGTAVASTSSLPPTTSSPVTTTLAGCAAPEQVSSAGELLAALEAVGWGSEGGGAAGAGPITPDLAVSGTVTISGDEVTLPASCLEASDCSHEAGFRLTGTIGGVMLEGAINPSWISANSTLSLADTTVRLRPVLFDTHPAEFNAVPLVEVLPPCETACAPGLAMCPADGACYAPGEPFCRACEGGGPADCACRTPEGSMAEGASCLYWESGDFGYAGTCREGVCVSPDDP